MKMSDLKVHVPLAAAEDAELDELSSACAEFAGFQSGFRRDSSGNPGFRRDSSGNPRTEEYEGIPEVSRVLSNGFDSENNILSNGIDNHLSTEDSVGNISKKPLSSRSSPSSGEMDNFGEGETLSGSLEDLVSNFDQKITECFKNYTETTDEIAPVQVRTQEEIMSESQ